MTKQYAENFPAVHLKMDRWFYFSNFSSELLVTLIVIGVAGFTIGNFYISPSPVDQSWAMKLLSYHSDRNPKAYIKSNSIKTVVVDSHHLVPEAYADNSLNLAAEASADADPTTTDDQEFVEDNAIFSSKEPDMQKLINKQFQVYVTQENDTLGSIARQYDISIDTIKWANKLPNNTIKPGWNLIIPLRDGVLYRTDSNDTLPDIAKYFSGNIDTIIAYNGLQSPNIDADELIFIPDGKFPAPKPVAKPVPSKKALPTYAVPKGGLYKGSHSFVRGQCTWYVASLVTVPWGGDAKYWAANARAMGYAVDKLPRVGDIMQTSESKYGHVVLITAVDGTQVTFTEMNYKGPFIKSTRTLDINDSVVKAVIHVH